MGSRLKGRDQTPDLPPPKTQDRQVSVGGDMYTEGLPVLWRSDPEGQRGGRWATQHPSESEDKTAGHLVHGAGQAVSRSTSLQEAAAWLPVAIHTVTYWLRLPSTTKAGGGSWALAVAFHSLSGHPDRFQESGGSNTTGIGVNSQVPSGPDRVRPGCRKAATVWVQTGNAPDWERGRSQAVWEGIPQASLC